MANVPKKVKKNGTRPFRLTLMEQLRDPEVAAAYVANAQKEGLPLPRALADVIEAQGLANVARKADIAMPNVLRAVREKANPTYNTLNRLLAVLGLELTVRKLKHRPA